MKKENVEPAFFAQRDKKAMVLMQEKRGGLTRSESCWLSTQ
jgi:hypothetical protein